MLAIVLALALSLGGYFIVRYRQDAALTQQRLEEETLRRQESRLQSEIDSARSYLTYMRSQTESVLRANLRRQVDQAYQIAEAIYRQQQGKRPEREIQHLIVEALRPLRFFDGRGYFFVDDLEGHCILLPIRPELEGRSLQGNRDDRGAPIMARILAAAQQPGGGYVDYRWYPQGRAGQMADKTAYAREFRPFHWIIGAGEYRRNVEDDLQRQALDRLRTLRFGQSGYIAVLHRDGRVLSTPYNPGLEGRPVDRIESPEARAIISRALELGRSNGGYLRYDWYHPDQKALSPKLSLAAPAGQWDWILVAGVYLDDLQQALLQAQAAQRRSLQEQLHTLFLVLTVAVSVCLVFSLFFSRWLGQLFRHYRHDRERRNHELERQARELRLAAQVFENGNEGIYIADRNNRILTVNRMCCHITGYQAEELVGHTPTLLSSGQRPQDFYSTMEEALYQDGAWSGEVWNRRKNGETYPEWLNLSLVRDDQDRPLYRIATFSDISSQKAAEAQLRQLAQYDSLTRLPNRVLLMDRIGQALATAQREQGRLAVLFLDLDRFKNINDSLGHGVGDKLLCALAQRLQARLRSSDTVSRIGGDEFVILLPDSESPEQLATVAAKLIEAVAGSCEVDGHELSVTTSVGIALFPENGATPDELMKNADTAMYYAKECGRNTFKFFTAEMNARVSERLALENSLRHALARQELVLFYQPQYSLIDGHMTGCEALVRWQHPTWGLIPPTKFIPVAEECGLILPIGTWVLREACRQAKLWQDQGHPPLTMAVNLSAVQFHHVNIVEMVSAALADSGLDPCHLELEVTESVLMDDLDATAQTLEKLKEMGISLALDDFGTGYSSLSYLKRLRLDKLKIDRSFISDLPGDGEDAAITRAIISLARHLGLHTLAEGVETRSQWLYLQAAGCTAMQGYLKSRPVPAAEYDYLFKAEVPTARPERENLAVSER